MHSVTYAEARKNNLITFIPDSRGEITIPTYLGMVVVVDDQMPTTAGTNHTEYQTYLLKRGAFAWAQGVPRVPTEVDRDPEKGNGGGQETLFSRQEFILHPRGIAWISGSMAGQSPTIAELILAANWNRVHARKNIGIAVLKHNND